MSLTLQENTCAVLDTLFNKETPTQVFSCEICEIFKNTFSYRTSLVAASGQCKLIDWLFVG